MSFRSIDLESLYHKMLPRHYLSSETFRKLLNPKKRKPLYKIYFENEIAYTEDHIPVRKLYLCAMPMELTPDALFHYFTQNNGRVLGIERAEASEDEEQKYLPTWNAFVLFADARDAAKVLQVSERLFLSFGFHVQACYSWLQPVAVEESNELEFATSPSILQLNDDCLECVFQYLPLADQIRLARTCTRFRNIYQRIAARQHKSVGDDVTKDLTLWETREFCQLSGHHVKRLTCHENANANFRHFFYAGLYFPNLKDLYVFATHLKVHKLQRILLETPELTKLTLKTLPRTDRLELAQLKDLKTLKISEWNTESLSLPTSIESLTFHKWREISCLPSILKGHTKIKKLEVNDSANVFKELDGSQALASVEVLRIKYCDFYTNGPIAQLPKLKKLCLQYSNIEKDFFFEIIKDTPHQLDHLEIWPTEGYDFDKEDMLKITSLIGLQTLALHHPKEIDDEVISAFGKLTELKSFGLASSDITDGSLLKLLINCPKLSKLTTEDCRNISDNLVDSITRLLRKDIQSGKNQRDLPFKLYLNDYKLGSRNIRHTDPDIVEVLLNKLDIFDWFDEEFKC